MYRFSTSRARQEAVFVIHNRLLTRAARYMRLPWGDGVKWKSHCPITKSPNHQIIKSPNRTHRIVTKLLTMIPRRQIPNALTVLRLILAVAFFAVLAVYQYQPHAPQLPRFRLP